MRNYVSHVHIFWSHICAKHFENNLADIKQSKTVNRPSFQACLFFVVFYYFFKFSSQFITVLDAWQIVWYFWHTFHLYPDAYKNKLVNLQNGRHGYTENLLGYYFFFLSLLLIFFLLYAIMFFFLARPQKPSYHFLICAQIHFTNTHTSSCESCKFLLSYFNPDHFSVYFIII